MLKWIFLSIARSPEMVLAVSIGWCAAAAASAAAMGLSKEMGALVAGLSISAFPYSIHVTAKTLPLRDFFLTLFFMSLGMQIIPLDRNMVLPLLWIVGFVFVSRFLSVYPLVIISGAGRRAAFVSSLNLAQISEFSLVIASIGVQYKHITDGTNATMIYAMAITAVLSSYAIRYNHQLYLLFNAAMDRLRPSAAAEREEEARAPKEHEIAILGYHRGARALVDALQRHSPELLERIMVIDFNPIALEELRVRGVASMFGDISSLDTLKHAHIGQAKIVLSTIPDMLLKGTDNVGLVRSCQDVAPRATFVATADDLRHEQRLRSEGADFVVRPYELVGEWLAAFVAETLLSGGQKQKQQDPAVTGGKQAKDDQPARTTQPE